MKGAYDVPSKAPVAIQEVIEARIDGN